MPVITGPATPAGGTAVPTDGTFANANWAEVYFPDHDFTGRSIVTNGLLLADLSVGTSYIARTYLWSTGLSTPAWQKCFDLAYQDNAGNIGTLNSITGRRIGQEESSVKAISSTSGGKASDVLLRLQRGRYEMRADFAPLVEASTTNLSLSLVLPATPKIIYNSGAVADVVLSETNPAVQTDYGYACAFIANSADPFIVGFVYQNQPGGKMPYNAGNVATVGLGDTSSLSAGPPPALRSYGVFAVPYGVNGSYSTANLQAEAESGTLGTGWSSVTTSGESANAAAKAASGTTSASADTFGTAFVPAPGTYDVWFRVKVTTNVGSAAEMTLGLWDSTSSAFVPSGSTTFNRTAMGTSYAWVRAATAVTPTAAHSMRFQAVTALVLGTDWFVDEAVMLPKTLTTAHNGPQDIYQQWAYDRGVRLSRP